MDPAFDQPPDRRASDSIKWTAYPPDVIPLWVADMDFASPQPVIDALRRRIDHGVFGYSRVLPELAEAVCRRLQATQNWEVEPSAVVLIPGLVSALNIMCRLAGAPGETVLVNTPVYPPFLSAPRHQDRQLLAVELGLQIRDRYLRYEPDFDALEAAVTPDTRLFLLCNPQNPTGRAFTPAELIRTAELCERHNLLLCSDEIHGDLTLGQTRHLSIAALVPELAPRTVTLLAPSKTWNIPTLGCSLAVIPDPELRRRFREAAAGIVPEVGALGQHAALAAYTSGEPWLQSLRQYLTANRDLVTDFVVRHLPGVRVTCPEATYLAWLDCRDLGLEESPFRFFLERAKVALNDGRRFGLGGTGFVRLNFGCARATLVEALERLKGSLSGS